jgi:hypothetical protein
MRVQTFSHCNGENVVDSTIRQQLLNVLVKTEYKFKAGCANHLRNLVLSQLKLEGWSDEFQLASNSQISLTSCIDDHILCMQTGNVSRFYADLLKLQFVYLSNKAKAAIYIIPSKESAKIIGSNIANFDRFVNELALFKHIITIPTIVYGIN